METNTKSKKRLLAAIMFTDIVGYTAMMQENEVEGAAIRERHREIFQKEHQRCNGEIIQYYGDGTLSIFQSAVEGVVCAIAMQQEFQLGDVVPLRIGLHLGDIVFDENDVYGDGVNLASRIESLGVPGSVLVSDKMHHAIKSQGTILTESLGHFEFKNIKEAVEVYSVNNNGIVVPQRDQLQGKLKEKKKTVAVLPFVNMSSDPENEYFSDGIAEEILNALVKLEGLQVTARTSSFSFKGKNLDVREIGRQLGVAHILEGSVRRSGNRVRITAQLVSALDGYHFFSETYDRTLDDIFAVQDEIASAIAHRLRQHLGEAEQGEQLVTAPTSNIEAYETYLKGLFYFNQFGDDEAMGKAIPYFEKAIEMQPDFGLPSARLLLCYLFASMGGKVPRPIAEQNMTNHRERLKDLNVSSGDAYFAISAYEVFMNWDWKAGLVACKKGLELFPNHATLYHMLATFYWIDGDLNAIMKYQYKGLELDPLSVEMIFYAAVSHLWWDDFEKAVPLFDKVLEQVPHHRAAREYKGWIAVLKEEYEEAISIFEKLEPFGYRLHRSTCLAYAYFKMGDSEKVEKYLQELQTLEQQSVFITLDLATLYTCMRDFDQAFHFLEKAIQNRVGDVMMLRSNFFFKALRGLPDYKRMEELIGEVPFDEV